MAAVIYTLWERRVRLALANVYEKPIEGLNRVKTKKPTSYALQTIMSGILVLYRIRKRKMVIWLSKPLTSNQKRVVELSGFSSEIYEFRGIVLRNDRELQQYSNRIVANTGTKDPWMYSIVIGSNLYIHLTDSEYGKGDRSAIDPEQLQWLNDTIAENQDKNIIVQTHYGLANTTSFTENATAGGENSEYPGWSYLRNSSLIF